MSSFPQHEENLLKLQKMGFNIDEYLEDGKVTLESWGYDDLTYLVKDLIGFMEDNNSSSYGDGWYSGFLDAKSKYENGEDLCDYNTETLLMLSEAAEDERGV